MDYEPISPELLAELREMVHGEGAGGGGLTMLWARRTLHELERAERERQRLSREIESARASRMALRETLFAELQDARKKITELEAELQRAQALKDGAFV